MSEKDLTKPQEEWVAPTKVFNVMFVGIFLANTVTNLAVKMSNASLQLYANDLSAPADQIGILMSMFAYTALVCRFIAGPTMNAFNRKIIAMCAMLLFAVVYFGYAASPAIAEVLHMEVIYVLILFRALQGLANAFCNACCMAVVADCLPKDKFSTGMGFYGCATIIANAFGPMLGSASRAAIGVNKTYYIVIVVQLIAVLLMCLVKTAPRPKVKFKLNVRNMVAKEALLPTFIYFLCAVGYAAMNAFLLVYDEERGVVGASLYFTVYSFAQLVTRPFVGKLADQYGFVKVTVPCAALTAVSMIMVAHAMSLPMLLLSAIISAAGFGGFQPVVQGLCIKAVGPDRRGSATSTNFIGLDLSSIVAPTITGYVASVVGYVPAMWYAMTAFILLGLVFTVVFAKRLNRIEADFLAKQPAQETK